MRWPEHAVRTSRRASVFTAIAILTMALGIVGTRATFSIVDSVLLDPLADRYADRLVVIG